MSLADEVAADERRAAPAVHCLAVLDGLQVARDDPRSVAEDGRHRAARDDPRLVAQDVRCRAARDDPRLVARDVRHRAVLDDLKQTHLPTSNCLNPRPVKARSYTPSFGATKARTYPALISRSRCSSGTMHCFVRCLSSSKERNSSGVRRSRGTDNNPRSNLLVFSLRVLCRTARAGPFPNLAEALESRQKAQCRFWPIADIPRCTAHVRF